MKIEIWSDIVCPFCFIGKHRLEEALKSFPEEKFEIVYRSFQLNPDEMTDPTLNHPEHLAKSKGWTKEYTQQAHEHVCKMGESCEIAFEFERVKVVNSFDAHRLLHFARTKNLQIELKEKLFSSHFEKGMNIGDKMDLLKIAKSVGLSTDECRRVLDSDQFGDKVRMDMMEAAKLGIRGVPFFVFGEKYAVSGAQNSSVFKSIVEKVIGERKIL